MEFNSQKKKTDKQKSARKKGINKKNQRESTINGRFRIQEKRLFELEEKVKLLEGQMEVVK